MGVNFDSHISVHPVRTAPHRYQPNSLSLSLSPCKPPNPFTYTKYSNSLHIMQLGSLSRAHVTNDAELHGSPVRIYRSCY